MAMRFASTPFAARRGVGNTDLVTNDCTPMGRLRWPSKVNVTHVPSTGAELAELDDERKAAMVSNLMVVLCGEKAAQPILNAGTLYN